MPDDREDRRQKDRGQKNRRDLEFYRQRVRPSATDLWRRLERPRSDRTEADAIWPLVCAIIVLVVTAMTDSVGRLATALPF